MKKRVWLLGLLALVLCPSDVEAKDWMVTGVGQFSCGHWTQNMPTRSPGTFASSANMPAALDTQWVQGFLSAFNYYGNGSGNVTNGTDVNGVFAWIDNYCAAHPLDLIADATIALVSELSKRAGQ